MNGLAPRSWLPNFSRLLPSDVTKFVRAMITLWLTTLYLVAVSPRPRQPPSSGMRPSFLTSMCTNEPRWSCS